MTSRSKHVLRDLAVVCSLYGISTAVYRFLGVTFDAGPATYFMQFIDPELLRDRLWESLWYYHANPPMLNLLVGATGKLFGAQRDVALALVFHALGFLTALSVYLLTSKLSGSRVAAGVATALLVFSPEFVLFENWLMYSFPAVALLTMSAFALYRYVQTRSTTWCVGFFALLAALLLTRGLFHLVWMGLIAGLLLVLCRDRWRQVAVAAALPVLVVAGWYGKNWYYFGSFSSSTWMGLGFVNISTMVLTRPEIEAMVARQEISQLALISRYDHPGLLFTAQEPPTGIPVLDEPVTSVRTLNYNYRPIVAISRAYMADGLKVIRAHPSAYVTGVGLANRLFFSPATINPLFTVGNRRAAAPLSDWLTPLLYGVSTRVDWMRAPRFGFDHKTEIPVHTSVPLIIAWVLVLGYGYMQARKGVVAVDRSDQARAIVIGFIVLTCLYVYAVATGLEVGENYRYRYLTEPLFLVLGGTAVAAIVRKVTQARLAARSALPLAADRL